MTGPDPRSAPSTPGVSPFGLALLLCIAAALVPLWSVKYLPLTDLPQHVAQISIWKNLHDPAFGFDTTFELNWFTPYLLGYSLARLFAEFTSALTAVKLVITLAVVAMPLSMYALMRQAGRSPWWSLLGLPLAFSYSFYWGFVNYVLATPVVIAAVALALAYARAPTLRRGVALGVVASLVFFAHGLAFAFFMAISGPMIAAASPSLGQAVRRCVPLGVAGLLAVAWGARASAEADPTAAAVWALGFSRLPGLLGGLLSTTTVDTAAVGAVLLMLGLIALGGTPLARPRYLWIPFAVAASMYLLFPERLLATSILYQRFGVFVVPFALVALQERPRLRPTLLHGALVACTLVWMGNLTLRFQAFDDEMRGFDAALAEMPPRQRVRALVFDHHSEFVPGALPFVHAAAYYQAEKGGTLNRSFATSRVALARCLPGMCPELSRGAEWFAGDFRWANEAGMFDLFLVRAADDHGPALFGEAQGRVALVGEAGGWWLYRDTGR